MIATSSAQIERLLMRWPFSIRLKLQLREARKREARGAADIRARVLKTIREGLKHADLFVLKAVADQLQEVNHE